MKLFVTGATGFVGSHFVRHAIAAGHSVLASHRRGAKTFDVDGLTWLEADLDALPTGKLMGCHALVHFAAVGVSPKRASRQEMTYWNATVPQLLMESAREANIQRVVMAGSFAEYGRSAERFELIPPDAPLLPTSAYAASKAASFVTCHAAAIELGLELCYLRVFSAFGDGQFDTNFWPALRKAAMEGADFPMTAGEQLRDFVPVEDVAREFLYAVLRQDVIPAEPKTWNVGSGQPITIREFAKSWWQQWNATGKLQVGAIPYRPNEVRKFAPLITDRAPTPIDSSA
ncbi:MAG: NAD-dependent epimerase/dehydratase family protein [Paucibacter sp.]|nr:NAD-dependent epimerase/dehydratase family protein [Roseateles sp.]